MAPREATAPAGEEGRAQTSNGSPDKPTEPPAAESPASSGSGRVAGATSSPGGGTGTSVTASDQSEEEGCGVKLFLGGLAWETTEEKLRDHFSPFGEVARVDVMKDRITGNPRGFGFVTFRDEAVAERVCSEKHAIDGRQIDAKRSVPQGNSVPKPKSRKIFVGGLAPDTTDEQFHEHFSTFGTVADAQIMQDYTSGRSRGFGFVTFEDDASVEKVFMAGNMHMLAGKKVEVKTATPRVSGSSQQSGRSGGRGSNSSGGGSRGSKANHDGNNRNSPPAAAGYGATHGERVAGSMVAQPYGAMGQYGMQQGYGYPMGFPPYPAPYTGMMMPQMGYHYPQGYGMQGYGYMPGYHPHQGFASGPHAPNMPGAQAPAAEQPSATGVQ